jgi:Type VI secretion system/phage-baseplate injector OB domain
MPADLSRHTGRFYGKYRGTVTNVTDPSKLGRIKVKVPAVFPDGLEVTAQACFPPGHFWVPPVGAMVWVEFEAGDPQYPLWTGTWYTDGTPPADAALDPPDGRVIHTPSGHTVRFHDKAGEEKVVIRHRADSFVSIDEKGSVLIAAKDGSYFYLNADSGEVSVISKDGHMLTMTADSVTVAHHDGSFVELKADKVKVNAKDTVQVVGKQVVLGGGSIQLGGQPAQSKVLLGDLFGAAYAAHFHPTAVGPTGTPVPPYVPLAYESQTVTVQK